MNINRLLDLAKSLNGKQSDYRTAKIIGASPSAIYEWRAGRRKPTQEQVIRLAELAHLDPLQTLAMIEAERAPNDKMSHFWHDVAVKIAS
jgi:transcriptional regulator with XRE-family HTH domain